MLTDPTTAEINRQSVPSQTGPPSVPQSSADEASDRRWKQRLQEFAREKKAWEEERSREWDKIEDQVRQLTEAWLALEAEQREFMRLKESRLPARERIESDPPRDQVSVVEESPSGQASPPQPAGPPTSPVSTDPPTPANSTSPASPIRPLSPVSQSVPIHPAPPAAGPPKTIAPSPSALETFRHLKHEIESRRP